MNLYSLANPLGWGVPIALAMYVVVALTALILAHRVYDKSRRGRSWAKITHEFGTFAVLLFLVHLTFYVPEALKGVSLEEHARVVSSAALAGSVVGILGSACLVWAAVYGSLFRARTVWHRPFSWLALAQWALLMYGVGASAARWQRYKIELEGALDVEPMGTWRHYLALGGALVFTAIAARGVVRSLQATYRKAEDDFNAMVASSPYKNRLFWQRETVRGRLAELLWCLVPLRLYNMYMSRQLNQAAKRAAPPRERTWLDNLVIVLANMHNVPPPWGYTPGDEPDAGDGRRDANRT